MVWGPTENTNMVASACKISIQLSLLFVLFADLTNTTSLTRDGLRLVHFFIMIFLFKQKKKIKVTFYVCWDNDALRLHTVCGYEPKTKVPTVVIVNRFLRK